MGKGRLANGRRAVRDRNRERRMRQLKRELLSERPKEAPYTAADVPAPAVILVLGGFLLTLFFVTKIALGL